jgi:hypothetical protein
MEMGAKRPARKWKRYQATRANEAQVRKWFGNGSSYGIGVIFGAVSGGLASRDFDNLDAYQLWADAHFDLARILPTVATRRGRHVYCIAAAGSVEAIRLALGKPDGTGAIAFVDGELRAGVGCYSILPPSVHPSGHGYGWLIPLTDQTPTLDLSAAGFVGELPEERTHATERTELTEAMSDGEGGQQHLTFTPDEHLTFTPLLRSTLSTPFSPSSLLHAPAKKGTDDGKSDGLSEVIEAAVRRALPSETGQRNRLIFRLARELKAIAALADAQPSDLMSMVRRWHKLASPIIGTKPWDDTWFDFLYAWPRVKYPAGQEPVARAFERAAAAEPPAVAGQFERPEVKLLTAACRELQRTAVDAPFFLDARTAAKFLKIDHSTAWRWLRGLCDSGILQLVAVGDHKSHRASRYRYLAPL